MAYSYVFLEAARTELAEIDSYLTETLKSEQAAMHFLDQLERKIDLVCSNPHIFAISRMPELAEKGFRTVLVGGYVMLYQFDGEVVYIAHIFHQRQNYAHLV